MKIRLYDDVETFYGTGIMQGRTESGALLLYPAEAVAHFQLPGGTWPMGKPWNSKIDRIIIFEVPLNAVRKV